MDGSMVSTKSVLHLAIVDSHFDGHGGIDETDHSRWDSDKVGVSSIGSACEADSSVRACLRAADSGEECPALTPRHQLQVHRQRRGQAPMMKSALIANIRDCPGQSTNFTIDAKVVHGINNAQEGRHGLGLLSNLGLVDLELDIIVLEVCLHLGAIDVVNV